MGWSCFQIFNSIFHFSSYDWKQFLKPVGLQVSSTEVMKTAPSGCFLCSTWVSTSPLVKQFSPLHNCYLGLFCRLSQSKDHCLYLIYMSKVIVKTLQVSSPWCAFWANYRDLIQYRQPSLTKGICIKYWILQRWSSGYIMPKVRLGQNKIPHAETLCRVYVEATSLP